MDKLPTIASLIVAMLGSVTNGLSLTPEATRLANNLPIFFTENRGQWPDEALYMADGDGGLTWWIEPDGYSVSFTRYSDSDQETSSRCTPHNNLDSLTESSARLAAHNLKFKFTSAKPNTPNPFLASTPHSRSSTSVTSANRLSWNNNYFLGDDPSKWASGCGNFERVTQHNIWNGVDIDWRGTGNAVEFDFVIHPGADLEDIQIECFGLTGEIESTADGGELLLPTSLGILRQSLPRTYLIESDGSRTDISASFKVNSDASFGFLLPDEYDRTKTIVIDPLLYSTYLGGNSEDHLVCGAIGADNNPIFAGHTGSNNFPTTDGSYEEGYSGGRDGFIVSLNEACDEFIFCTYLGGSNADRIFSIALDPENSIYVTGMTVDNFPVTEGAFQSHNGGGGLGAAFVTKLNQNCSELVYSTYLGGVFKCYGERIIVSENGEAMVVGETREQFPTTEDAYQRNYGGAWHGNRSYDTFYTKLNVQGSELIYSTYLGGDLDDRATGIGHDGSGGVIIAGYTNGNFPVTENAFQTEFGGYQDNFVARFSSDGHNLIYCTYIGGADYDNFPALLTDSDGNAIIAGETTSGRYPITQNAFQPGFGGASDMFITKLNADGTDLIFSTFLGGTREEGASALAFDRLGNVLVTGYSFGMNFPTTENALEQQWQGGHDAVLAQLTANGDSLLYGSYIGGRDYEEGYCLLVDGSGTVIVAGRTESTNFPITDNAIEDNLADESGDAFIAIFDLGIRYLRWIDIPEAVSASESEIIEFPIVGESIIGAEHLTVTYQSDDLPDDILFQDNEDGSAIFQWHTNFVESGEYTATFTLSDGSSSISAPVVISIANVNRAPEYIELFAPPDRVDLPNDSLIQFEWQQPIDADFDSLHYRLEISGPSSTIAFSNLRETLSIVRRNELLSLLPADSLQWRVWAMDGIDSSVSPVPFTILIPLSARQPDDMPQEFSFIAFPNPFNGELQISLNLPINGNVSVEVFDLQGRRIDSVGSGVYTAGTHRFTWSAKDCNSGLYIVRVSSPSFTSTQKITLIK